MTAVKSFTTPGPSDLQGEEQPAEEERRHHLEAGARGVPVRLRIREVLQRPDEDAQVRFRLRTLRLQRRRISEELDLAHVGLQLLNVVRYFYSIHSFIISFVHSFVHSFIHPFIPSFIHTFIHPFILSFFLSLSLYPSLSLSLSLSLFLSFFLPFFLSFILSEYESSNLGSRVYYSTNWATTAACL